MTEDHATIGGPHATLDVAIVGAGPAGLATAIGAATRGLRVAVFDRRSGPIDKACGEGLMPAGLAALDRLGARTLLEPTDTAPFEAITYEQEDGSRATGRLPPPGGLGVRRVALSAALRARALQVGVALLDKCTVRGHMRVAGGIQLDTDAGPRHAHLLVAADGLHSPVRHREGLAAPSPSGPHRFGLRRHVRLAPWGRAVEVHFGAGVEAYVTPAGATRVGIAFLWDRQAVPEGVGFEALLARFPVLEARVRGVACDSAPLGAGPLLQRVRARTTHRVALVGDAAGYVDAITGEGLSQALEGAEALAAVLPDAIAGDGEVDAFAPYERHAARLFARYARLAHALLWISRRPSWRRRIVSYLAAHPRVFDRVLAATLAR